jgi:hypothetical protein
MSHLNRIFIISTILFSFGSSYATKFTNIEMPERVSRANLIVMAKVTDLGCFGPDDAPIQPGKICTAPGSENRIKYQILTSKVLYYRPHTLRPKSGKPPKDVTFAFTAMSHGRVPQDQYESIKGKEMIFLLREDRDGNFQPIHEAFFTASLDEKSKILKILKKKKSK